VIRVDRAAVAEPTSLHRVWQGKTETERAIEHYTAGPDGNGWNGKAFNFAVYKDDEVKDALERLFHGKCAYCESRFGHVAPEDIEHWRPKGAVQLDDGTEQKPGYYWLAATWSNLLPSCIDCNRRRRHEDAGDPANTQSGKEGLFPVADEAHRWRHHDPQPDNGEQPLLLDPCADHPEDYLEVIERDGKALVKAAQPEETPGFQRAHRSIEIFGLNRSELEEARRKQRLLLLHWLSEIGLAVKQLDGYDQLEQIGLLPESLQDTRDETRERLMAKLRILRDERRPESPYLLMKLPLIDGFMAEVGPDLTRLGVLPP